MLIDTLKTLCALPGVSGGEDAVRDYLRELAAPHADSIRVDAIGNLIIEKKGRIPGSKKLMLAAHMDEVGLMIRAITDDGYLKFDTVGGIDRRVLIGKPVLVGPKKVPGVIGLKAYHLTSREEEKTVPKLKDFYIDIGAEDKETAEDLVYRGDLVVFDTDILEFGHGFLKAKAIDDRIGCAVMAELLQELPSFLGQVLNKRSKQLSGDLQVPQVQRLDRAVHVFQWKRQHAGGDPLTSDLYPPGVGPAVTRHHIQIPRQIQFVGFVHKTLTDPASDVGTDPDDGPLPSRKCFVFGSIWGAGVGHVYSNEAVGGHRKRMDHRATAVDLLPATA